MLTVTPLYAGLIALLFVTLSLRVSLQRMKAKVSYGDGGDTELGKRIRVQANCAEYAPIGLILLAMAELQGAPLWVVHLLGASLLLGRLMHAYGLGGTPQHFTARQFSMVLTYATIAFTAIANIGHALF